MIDVEKILKANSAVDDYHIISKKTVSYEVFFVHRKLETVRATDTTAVDVTVYVKHDGKLGDSGFAVSESMTEADVTAKVESAVRRAALVFNEPYTLPEGGVDTVELKSNFKKYSLPELASRIADAVFAADSYSGGSINATEIFVYEDTVTVKNSRGIDKTQVKYHAMIEAIPTWNEGEESVELYEDYRFTEFDAAEVTAEIDRRMREVRDRQIAVKPQTPLVANVVFNPHEIESLLEYIAHQLNFSSVYTHANLFKVGDDIQKDAVGDRVTLTMVGEIEGSVGSARFDADGVELIDKTVIEDGRVVGNYGANRFACYLGEKPTGNLHLMKLAPGSLNAEELASAPYFECVSLSGLQVDLYNDYVGGEIRLAYYFDGEKITPVTGISMSMKFSEVMASVRLSKETATVGNYTGPAKLLFKNVTIV